MFRRIGILLLAVSPLLFALAAWRAPQVDAPARWDLALNHEDAVVEARQALERLLAQDLAVDGPARLWVRHDAALERYLDVRATDPRARRAVAAARRLAPPLVIMVELPLSFGGHATLRLAPDGRLVAYELPAASRLEEALSAASSNDATTPDPATISELEVRPQVLAAYARRQAVEAHQVWLRGLEVALGEGSDEMTEDDSGRRTFTWVEHLDLLPELELSLEVELQGRQVQRQGVRARVVEDNRPKGLSSAARAIVGVLWGLLVVWAVVRGLLRYAFRLSEREVSHPRTFLLAIAMAVLSLPLAYQLILSSDIADLGSVWPFVLSISLLAVLPVSLLFSFVWAGCEADLRELDRRSLLSFDAWLRGRWGRREVAWSVLVGAACASWLLALRSFLPMLFEPGLPRLMVPVRPALFLLDGGWPFGFALACIVALPLLVLGLIAPLSYLRRWPRAALLVGSLTNFLGLLLLREAGSVPTFGAVLDALIWTAAIVVPFLVADLLAAAVSHVLAWFGLHLICLVHQPARELGGTAVILLAGIGTALLVFVVIWRVGRLTSVEEVMPRYVRKMRERQVLAEEVTSATVARDRLLRSEPPQASGAALSVVTVAGQQAGAYHDFFELDANRGDKDAGNQEAAESRVAMVVADFGWGLAAALRLTLAKGFLISFHRRRMAPEAVVRRLLERLEELVTLREQEDEAAVAYAVYSPRDRRVQLALARHSPLVVLLRSGQRAKVLAGFDTRHTAVLERDSRSLVSEREVQLEPGEALAIVLLGDIDLERWWRRLRRRLRDCLHAGPADDAATFAQRLRDAGVEPVTVVLLRADGDLSSSMNEEGVA